jgi:hypothetical protein
MLGVRCRLKLSIGLAEMMPILIPVTMAHQALMKMLIRILPTSPYPWGRRSRGWLSAL